MPGSKFLLIEAFYGGSHKQLIDLLYKELSCKASLYTLPAKKWHWRARTSALYFAETIPTQHSFRVIFTTSVLNLAELSALRPDLAKLYKIVYFHENQMVYPVRNRKDRDFQYGYNEVLTSLVADKIIFNSNFNQESFLNSLTPFFKIVPDYKSKDLEERIRPKCSVLYYPIQLPSTLYSKKYKEYPFLEQFLEGEGENKIISSLSDQAGCSLCETVNIGITNDKNPTLRYYDIRPECYLKGSSMPSALKERNPNITYSSQNESNVPEELHIIWPHRWEHDKGPEAFFSVMFRLKENDIPFKLSILGESYTEKPEIFHEAKEYLKGHIIHWDYQDSKEDYFEILCTADVVVSTADHEFFGVAMLEAVSCGCYPLCPRRLVYPEIFPDEYLYNTTNQLYKKLKNFCKHPYLVRKHNIKVDVKQFTWETLKKEYLELFQSVN